MKSLSIFLLLLGKLFCAFLSVCTLHSPSWLYPTHCKLQPNKCLIPIFKVSMKPMLCFMNSSALTKTVFIVCFYLCMISFHLMSLPLSLLSFHKCL